MSTPLRSPADETAAGIPRLPAIPVERKGSGQGCACDSCQSDCPNARGFLRETYVHASSPDAEAGR